MKLPYSIFFICNIFIGTADAVSFIDGDFDNDGFVDKVEIIHDKGVQFSFTPSSTQKKITYNLEYLNDSDNGFSDLYKYSGKNYVVSYYSDYRGGEEYSEDLYRWDTKSGGFVLYLNADVSKTNKGKKITTKMAKCCFLLGGKKEQPLYFSGEDAKGYAKEIILSIKSDLASGGGGVDGLTIEELHFLSNYHISEDRGFFYSLKNSFKNNENEEIYNFLSALIEEK